MNKSENKYNKVIDIYYNELSGETPKDMSIEETILSDTLNLALNKMDILKDPVSPFDINILEIIKEGELIKQNKRNSLEFSAFISFSLFIILSLILITFYLGETFFIYYELLTFIIIPILIVPLSKLSRTGGD
ncbi:MAG: hypothetical protein H7Y18_03910 [Clostridiaceae bacterium]|nr:hypothetical protein [Clostridiaceae bacterium]